MCHAESVLLVLMMATCQAVGLRVAAYEAVGCNAVAGYVVVIMGRQPRVRTPLWHVLLVYISLYFLQSFIQYLFSVIS
jgi:hypothetical protein